MTLPSSDPAAPYRPYDLSGRPRTVGWGARTVYAAAAFYLGAGLAYAFLAALLDPPAGETGLGFAVLTAVSWLVWHAVILGAGVGLAGTAARGYEWARWASFGCACVGVLWIGLNLVLAAGNLAGAGWGGDLGSETIAIIATLGYVIGNVFFLLPATNRWYRELRRAARPW